MNTPPVLLLGGDENALSVARSLSRYGVRVRSSGKAHAPVAFSRHSEHTSPRDGQSFESHWDEILRSGRYNGSIVLSCADDAMIFVARNRQKYADHFRFEENPSEQTLALLDKRRTIDLASAAGIDAPRYFDYTGSESLPTLQYPLLIKPIHSHLYQRVFRRKLKLVENEQEAEAHLAEVKQSGLEVMVCEYIPGPDNLLCSYFSYFDANGEPMFDFTKCIIRRFPENFGRGCYHRTVHLPEVVEAGKQLFQSMNFRGMANVEFKRDTRDGKLKVIEVNARFVATQRLLMDAGLDTARIVYDILADRTPTIPKRFIENKTMWYPRQDFSTLFQANRRYPIGALAWLKSVVRLQPHTLSILDVRDPWPVMMMAMRTSREILSKKLIEPILAGLEKLTGKDSTPAKKAESDSARAHRNQT